MAELFLGVFTEECWRVFVEGVEQLFVKADPVGVVRRADYYLPCAQLVLSKLLGYVVILGSLGFKVPQMAAIWSSKSAAGLSTTAFELDVLVFLSAVGYSLRMGFPVSAYGEQGVVLVQNAMLVLLVWRFSQASPTRVVLGLASCASAGAGIATLPQPLLWTLPAVAIVTNMAARVPQILTNLRQKHTGQLSAVTLLIAVLGSFARVITTLTETGDPVMLLSYSIGVLLNGTVFAQYLIYSRNTQALLDAKKQD